MNRPAHDGTQTAEALERRYRRLFTCYLAAYRAASQDEMLGVAMSGTKPGQRWPTPGEVRSLVAGGTRIRLGSLLSGARRPAWRDASAVFTFLAAALLATMSLKALVVHLLPLTYGEWAEINSGPGVSLPLLSGGTGRLTAGGELPAVLWPVVAVMAAKRWRWATAVGAALDDLCVGQ